MAITTWIGLLSAEKRLQLRSLHDINPAWNMVAVLFPVMWAAGVALVLTFPFWGVHLIGYVLSGIAIHSMVILTHETSHYSMFRNRRLDRWVGFLMGAPVFLSHTAYRVLHGDHHRHTREDGDPDEFKNVTKNRFLLSLLFYSWLVIGTPIYLIHVPTIALRRGTARERFDVLVEYALLTLIFAGVYFLARHYGRMDIIVQGWAIPMILGMIFGNFRSWAEHSMTIPGDPLTRTRTVTSNRVVSFLMVNLNYHLEHHLCPGIPWYNLPKMHALLQEEYRRAGSFIYKSYLRFLWDALRNGVHGISAMSMPMM